MCGVGRLCPTPDTSPHPLSLLWAADALVCPFAHRYPTKSKAAGGCTYRVPIFKPDLLLHKKNLTPPTTGVSFRQGLKWLKNQ